MNAITKRELNAPPIMHMTEAEQMSVLSSSIYPGAKTESIKMVLNYCRASGLDPMLKPVHIVPMDVPTGRKDNNGYDITEKRDVIMPGVGLYRVQAEDSGVHAGTSEPEFGPDITVVLGETKITYPEWCRVAVTKIVAGKESKFTAVEYWLENYATKGRKPDPNKMWAKRPRGQLAKCAEAQALRKAFPGRAGSQPTAEEMEGKQLDEDAITGEVIAKTVSPVLPEPLPAYPDDKMTENLSKWAKLVSDGKKTADDIINNLQLKFTLTPAQIAQIKPPVKTEAVDGEFVAAMDAEDAK